MSNVSYPPFDKNTFSSTIDFAAAANSKDLPEVCNFFRRKLSHIHDYIEQNYIPDHDSDTCENYSCCEMDPNLTNIWERFAKIENEEAITETDFKGEFSDDIYYNTNTSIKLNKKQLVALPKYLFVKGDLTINECPKLESMPKQLFVAGKVILSKCPNLKAMPELLIVKSGLSVDSCPIKNLGKGCSVERYLEIKNCSELEKFAENDLTLSDGVTVKNCKKLKNLGEKIFTGGTLFISECEGIEVLPDLCVQGEGVGLKLEFCNNLKAIPNTLHNLQHLSITACPKLNNLNLQLTVYDVYITDCPSLSILCGNLNVSEDIFIKGCQKLDEKNLCGSSIIPNLPLIQGQSNKLSIKRDLFIENCENLTKLSNKLLLNQSSSSSKYSIKKWSGNGFKISSYSDNNSDSPRYPLIKVAFKELSSTLKTL